MNKKKIGIIGGNHGNRAGQVAPSQGFHVSVSEADSALAENSVRKSTDCSGRRWKGAVFRQKRIETALSGSMRQEGFPTFRVRVS